MDLNIEFMQETLPLVVQGVGVTMELTVLSLLLAAFANAKIFIVTTIVRNRLVSTITTVETTAIKFA